MRRFYTAPSPKEGAEIPKSRRRGSVGCIGAFSAASGSGRRSAVEKDFIYREPKCKTMKAALRRQRGHSTALCPREQQGHIRVRTACGSSDVCTLRLKHFFAARNVRLQCPILFVGCKSIFSLNFLYVKAGVRSGRPLFLLVSEERLPLSAQTITRLRLQLRFSCEA